MRKGKIPIFKDPHKGNFGVGLGQSGEQSGQPLAALMGLRVMLNIARLIHHRGCLGIAGFNSFEQFLNKCTL